MMKTNSVRNVCLLVALAGVALVTAVGPALAQQGSVQAKYSGRGYFGGDRSADNYPAGQYDQRPSMFRRQSHQSHTHGRFDFQSNDHYSP